MIVHVARSCVIESPAEAVWRLLRDFNSHAAWHPAIAASRIEAAEPGDLVGAVRVFRLRDGGALREQLIALSDRDMSLTYCLLEAPLPLNQYVATLRLRRVTDGDRTFLHWSSRFDAPPTDADALARLVGRTIYEDGMTALQARFRPGSPRAVAPPPGPRERPDPASAPDPGPTAGSLDATAIVIDRHGGPDVLVPRRIEVRPPGPGEIRLRHLAIGVNMVDVHGRAGDFGLAALPAVPGMEAAGVVLDVSLGVTHLAAGDRVVYACSPPGAYATFRTMPAGLVVRLPGDIPPEVAAAAFLKGLMADALVRDVHPIRVGETVLVHAAAGGLGILLSGWARALGATVFGVVSTEAKAAAALEAGCTAAIVTARQEVAGTVRTLTDGRGVDVAYDGTGRAGFDASAAALVRGGHLVSYGQVSGPIGPRAIDALEGMSIHLSRPNLQHYTETRADVTLRADRLFDALRRGDVRPLIDRAMPLRDAAGAHARLEARRNIGSVVLLP